MLTQMSSVTPLPTGTTGSARTSGSLPAATDGAPSFGSVLSQKVSPASAEADAGKYADSSSQTEPASANDASDALTDTAPAGSHSGKSKSKIAAQPPASAQTDGKNALLPPALLANDPLSQAAQSAALVSNSEADPALDAGAADQLSALLAQTRAGALGAVSEGQPAVEPATDASTSLQTLPLLAGITREPAGVTGLTDTSAVSSSKAVSRARSSTADSGNTAGQTLAAGDDPAVSDKAAALLLSAADGRHQSSDRHPDSLLSDPLAGDGSQPAGTTSAATTTAPFVSVSSGALAASAASASPPVAMLNAQLGSDEWQQAISQQVVMYARNNQSNAELRLHPQDLGAVQISLQINENQAQIHLASAHSQVRAALEAALPQLRAALAESGINLGQSSVGHDSASGQGQDNHPEYGSARTQATFTLGDSADDTPADSRPITLARPVRNGAIDTWI